MKELSKSVHTCQSYYQTSSDFLFWDSAYINVSFITADMLM